MSKFNIPDQEIQKFHLGGKIKILLSKKLSSQKELSIVYTPGISKICEIIKNDPEKVHSLTAKKNTVAVMTDGTAVLGLENIGAKAKIKELPKKYT